LINIFNKSTLVNIVSLMASVYNYFFLFLSKRFINH
jgi:hypothetical protein